jgi:hypothetical protein
MKVTVNTNEYKFTHGMEPRWVRGYGMWVFFIGGSGISVSFNGTYVRARAQAVKVAKAAGAREITVGA